MATDGVQQPSEARPLWWRVAVRKDVLAGLLFMTVAAIGLWVSRTYPVGTALRMGTGYVPRLLCWILLVLGLVVLVTGLRAADAGEPRAPARCRPIVLIPAALVAFALAIEPLGIVVAGLLMIVLGGLAGRSFRPLETAVAAAMLVFFTWAIFIRGLGLPIRVWPGG